MPCAVKKGGAMDKFSIYESVSYAVSTYRRHLFLSLAVGAMLGLVSWAGVVVPRSVAQALGVHKATIVVHQQQNHVRKNDTIGTKMYGFVRIAGAAFAKKALEYIKHTPLFYLLIIAFVWLLTWLCTMYLYVGFLRLMFDIQATDRGSYKTLFTGLPYFVRYLSASCLYTVFILLLAVVVLSVVFGLVSVISALLLDFISYEPLAILLQQLVVLLLITAALVAFVAYTMRYMFYGYCLIDKNCTVFESFLYSKNLTNGSLLRLVPLFLVMLGLFYLYTHFIGFFTGYSGFHHTVEFGMLSFMQSVCKGLALPFGGYMLVYVYRKLAS